ncbi:MAG: hypothetical protein IT174_08015 [Acidobacteria bacterium]|nr:hypothetical protein [Acidobacteriota bacterium]
MILKKFSYTLTLLALLSPMALGQTVPAKKPSDDPEALKKDAVAFLRETMADVNNLRTLENRISFSAELAGLMWFHDEKEARSLYLNVFANFQQLLMQYDMQMNQFPSAEADEEGPYSYRRGGMFAEITDKGRLLRRFQTAMAVRQQISMSLAEHDPELAFSFYFDSITAITNPTFRQQLESRDKFFEVKLMTEIARSNTAKAAEFAMKALDDGINYQHIELLKKIYEKDPEKGAELASAMLSKFKSGKNADDLWVASTFLNAAGESFEKSKAKGGKRPMLDREGLRDLADALAQAILDGKDEEGNGLQYVSEIEKYNPSRAVQIRAKFKVTATRAYRVESTANMAANRMARASNSTSNANLSDSRAERERLEREKAEKELQQNVEKLANKDLPKDQRDKVVADVRRILTQTPGKDKKIVGLSALAAQVAKAGDRELAAEIMKDAQALVNPQPKTYQDFLLSWMLANGYVESDPEKAFPVLEDTIMRANDTLAAFIKVGEFIDVAGDMIDEGEVQVGAFGGEMVRGLTSELGMADTLLKKLAKANFKKTRDLANRFDRSEIRILAKMMILRAVLDKGKQDPDKLEKEVDAALEK